MIYYNYGFFLYLRASSHSIQLHHTAGLQSSCRYQSLVANGVVWAYATHPSILVCKHADAWHACSQYPYAWPRVNREKLRFQTHFIIFVLTFLQVTGHPVFREWGWDIWKVSALSGWYPPGWGLSSSCLRTGWPLWALVIKRICGCDAQINLYAYRVVPVTFWINKMICDVMISCTWLLHSI